MDTGRIEQLENEVQRYKREVMDTHNSQTEEISQWRHTAQKCQLESGIQRGDILDLQREHEKVTHYITDQ